MAKATTGGASNAKALPGETGYVAPQEPAPPAAVTAPQPPPAPAAGGAPTTRAKPVRAVSAARKANPKAPAVTGGGGSVPPDPAVTVTVT